MAESRVGVIGASSLVGGCVLATLLEAGWQVVAFSRAAPAGGLGVTWRHLPCTEDIERISYWICLAPIWVMPDYFKLIESSGLRRIVLLSSTSRFTKVCSGDEAESIVAAKLIDNEERVRAWAESRGIEWVILRPTLIYGLGRDKSIAEIARFVRRYGVFPLFGKAIGLRQPLHAQDVAEACVAALSSLDAANQAYNLSGAETLPYRDMVARIFEALGRPVCLLPVPLFAFRFIVVLLRFLPRYRNWSSAMAERMNRDLVFDHSAATHDFGFKPRPFVLSSKDVSV